MRVTVKSNGCPWFPTWEFPPPKKKKNKNMKILNTLERNTSGLSI